MLQLPDTGYFYFKSWHVPEYDGIPRQQDQWLTIPMSVVLSNGKFHVTAPDLRIPRFAMMVVQDTGMVLAVQRGRPGTNVTQDQFDRIRAETISIAEWEGAMGRTWNFDDMFDTAKVEARFFDRYGTDRAKYYLAPADSQVFVEVFNTTKIQPCKNCGQKRQRR